MFAANGQFTNTGGRPSPWSVTEPGIVKAGIRYFLLSVLPDGSFYLHEFYSRIGSITGHIEHWGTVCH
jgi:hypothetical protein